MDFASAREVCRQLEHLIRHKKQLNMSQVAQREVEALIGIRKYLLREIDVYDGLTPENRSHSREQEEQVDVSSSKDVKTLKLLAKSLELLADKLEQDYFFKNKNKKKSKKRVKKLRSTSASRRSNPYSSLKQPFDIGSQMEYLNSEPENILGKPTNELHLMRQLSARNDIIFNMALGVHACEFTSRPVDKLGERSHPGQTHTKSADLFLGNTNTEIAYSQESWLYT